MACNNDKTAAVIPVAESTKLSNVIPKLIP